jgi:hypothetical protein
MIPLTHPLFVCHDLALAKRKGSEGTGTESLVPDFLVPDLPLFPGLSDPAEVSFSAGAGSFVVERLFGARVTEV